MLSTYIAVELLNIATAYELDHIQLLKKTISRQDMSCLLLDAPQTNRFVLRLPTTEYGKKNYQRVIRTDGSEQKGFGFLLSLQHLFKRWLHLHGMWQPILPSNAETVSVQSDFQSEKAQVLATFQQCGMNSVLIQRFSDIFEEIRKVIASFPNSSCDRDNFRHVMIQMMNLQLCPRILVSKVDSLFACFDLDGNGTLDATEIMHGFRTLFSKNQSAIADLAFRFADSAIETHAGPFSGAQNQKLNEEEFKKLILTVCRDEPYVLQVILSKLCLQELPFFDASVTQIPAQAIEALRFYLPLTSVRDFANPIADLQHHQALAVALLEDPQAGPVLLGAICRAVLLHRKRKSPELDQHDFRQIFETNQLFGWMLRFWLLRGFLTEEHPQFLRLSGLLPPREIQFSDNIEASEAKARLRHQHLAWYFSAFNTTVDDLLLHLQRQYLEITGSTSGQINQGQFEKLISSIFTNLGIRDQVDFSMLFMIFDADQSGEISRKEIIDGFVLHFHRIESVFNKILTYFEQKMIQDQSLISFCSKYNISVMQFLEKLKSLFVSRSTSLTSEIDCSAFCSLWKQLLIDFGIRRSEDPNIDVESSHMFHVADTSGNGNIDFAELMFFVSEQCVRLLQKSTQERQKIEDLLLKAAQHQDKHGTPQVLGEHTTQQFLSYAWACFQKLASTQKRDPVHFECSKQEFSQLWDELKHQLGFGDEEPSMHIDQVYPQIDIDNSGTISAVEMIDGLIRHFIPRAEASRSQSRAPSSRGSVSQPRTSVVHSADARGSAIRAPKRPSATPGSPSSVRVNPADSKLLAKVREEPWCKMAQDEFDSIGEDSIDSGDFDAILTRMFEKKKLPIPSCHTLQCMFIIFDTNGDSKLSKMEFLCGLWRVLEFAEATAASSDDEDDEQGGEWEGDYMQYLRLALVPFSLNAMLSVDRLHKMFNEMLTVQCTAQGALWRPSSTLVNLFQRHKLILDSLESIDYDIDEEHRHIMQVIAQPGKTIDWDSMQAKISSCSFGLVWGLCFFCLSDVL
jgi:Ca2+-binding EF-hand superfamily protein